MTEQRRELIARFQQWLDTKPSKSIIAAQCATIAEEYAEKLLEQRLIQKINNDIKKRIDDLEAFSDMTRDDLKGFL